MHLIKTLNIIKYRAMNEFEVVITETLQRKVKVQASSKREARRKVLDMYHYEEIVLNEKDFFDYSVEAL